VNAVSADTLLSAWEQGLNQPPLNRALMLLLVTHPQWTADSVLAMTVGERDRELIELHQQLFGRHLNISAHCPECQQLLEWQTSTQQLLAQTHSHDGEKHRFPKPLSLAINGYTISCRSPTSDDVLKALNVADPTQALLLQCIESATLAGDEVAVTALPAGIYAAIEQALEKSDPMAVINFDLQCPECSYQWPVVFDIGCFIWQQLASWAEETLLVVYRLASAYGWSEADILRLSPVRRQLYMGIAGL
jgi:hypothetical protein